MIAQATADVPILLVAGFGVFPLAYLLVRQLQGRPLPPRNPEPFHTNGTAGFFFFALAVFFGYMVCGLLVQPEGGYGTFGALAGIVIAFLLAFIIHRTLLRQVLRPRDGVAPLVGYGLLVLWAALPVVFGAYLLIQLLGGLTLQEGVLLIKTRQAGWEYVAFFAVFVAPVLEEIAFRGMLYPALRRAAGPRTATVATAVAFGLIHVQPNAVAPLALFGVFLAWLVETTGSIVPCIVAHLGFNALTVAQLMLA